MKYQSVTGDESLEVVAELTRANALLMRRFESGLPGGLGFNEFMILFHLHRNEDLKMRRVDLADRLGVTSSAITRIVAPMEKLGIVKRQASSHDGRVVYVVLATGGKRLFSEALESARYKGVKIIPKRKASSYRELVAGIRV